MKKNFVKKQNMTVRKNWKGNGECVTMKLQNTPNFGRMLANTSTKPALISQHPYRLVLHDTYLC